MGQSPRVIRTVEASGSVLYAQWVCPPPHRVDQPCRTGVLAHIGVCRAVQEYQRSGEGWSACR